MENSKFGDLENPKKLQFGKFDKFEICNSEELKKFPILRIPEIGNLGNSKNGKIRTIPKISNFENSKNWQFGNFEIWKMRKYCNLEYSKSLSFGKSGKFALRKIEKNSNW